MFIYLTLSCRIILIPRLHYIDSLPWKDQCSPLVASSAFVLQQVPLQFQFAINLNFPNQIAFPKLLEKGHVRPKPWPKRPMVMLTVELNLAALITESLRPNLVNGKFVPSVVVLLLHCMIVPSAFTIVLCMSDSLLRRTATTWHVLFGSIHLAASPRSRNETQASFTVAVVEILF